MLKQCIVLLFLMTQSFVQAADSSYTSSDDDSSSDDSFKTYEFNGFEKGKDNWVNVGLWEHGKINPDQPWPPHLIVTIPVEKHSTFADLQHKLELIMHRDVCIVGVGPELMGPNITPLSNDKLKNHAYVVYNHPQHMSTIRAMFPSIPALQQKLRLREMTGKKIHQ